MVLLCVKQVLEVENPKWFWFMIWKQNDFRVIKIVQLTSWIFEHYENNLKSLRDSFRKYLRPLWNFESKFRFDRINEEYFIDCTLLNF